MKRIEPLKYSKDMIVTGTNLLAMANKIDELIKHIEVLENDFFVHTHNEAVEPKEDEWKIILEQLYRYREALEKIADRSYEAEDAEKTITAELNEKRIAIVSITNIAKSALNPTPPDKTCPSNCECKECVAKNFPIDKTTDKSLEDVIMECLIGKALSCKNPQEISSEDTLCNFRHDLATEIWKWIREQTAEIYKKQYPEFDSMILREPQIAVMNYIKDLRKALEAIGE